MSMDDSLKSRTVETYALFKRLVMMLEAHVELSKDNALTQIEQVLDGDVEEKLSETLSTYNYVIHFVDLVARIKKAAYKIPGMNQKSAEYREFESALGNLLEVRNRFQHAVDDIGNYDSDNLLGSISWAKGSSLYFLALLDISRGRSSHSIRMKVNDDYQLDANGNDGLNYVLNEEVFNLDRIYASCITFSEYIDRRFTIKVDGEDLDMKKRYSAVKINVIPPSATDEKT